MFTFITAVLGVNGITQVYKNAVLKYGDTHIHIALGIISLATALLIKTLGGIEIFQNLLADAVAIFASALALYHVLWKQLGDMGISDDLA
jgi:hypothetical protein